MNLFAQPLVRIGLILLALLAIVVGIKWCDSSRDRAAQAKLDSRSATATAATARDAARTVIARGEADMALDEVVAATVDQIEAETDAKVSGATARNAICSMPAYASDVGCKR